MKRSKVTKPDHYRVIHSFRYPNEYGAIVWHEPDTEVTLPKHVAGDLIRQGKVEEI